MDIKIKDLLQEALGALKAAHVPGAKREAEEILAFFLGKQKNELFFIWEEKVKAGLAKKIRRAVQRRAEREPLGYILGSLPFYNVQLQVSRSVLIPRFETEYLADLIVQRLKKSTLKGKVLFDLCTGSGALAIALKKALPNLKVFASDLSQRALQLARKNALSNGVEVVFLCGDLFRPFGKKKADFIVANPPYVAEKELKSLPPEVLFEPKKALFGGRDGFLFYRRLARALGEKGAFLKSGGQLFLEIGAFQGKRVAEIFSKKGFKGRILRDLSGRERFFFIEKQ
ncbi:MAG: peptide chain release factor N(5)-glutamine methyltransferase [Parachlamydiales bacterium]|jgi:release factor glutamine methyltransferase